MELAILFWCYRSMVLCEDRLRHLRRDNPGRQIFVLFGGDPEAAAEWERRLRPLSDDFWVFELPDGGNQHDDSDFRGGSRWKWRYGDLLLTEWFTRRGATLTWDTVLVVQWDLIVYGDVARIVGALGSDEILLPGLRPIAEIEQTWSWTKAANPDERTHYRQFMELVEHRYGYEGEPRCFLALLMALPRSFLERYADIEEPETGFLEYRIPIYADVYGTPVCTDHRVRPSWHPYEGRRRLETLNAESRPISPWVIALSLLRPRGPRVFHPYFDVAPRGLLGWSKTMLRPARRRVRSILKRSAAADKPVAHPPV